MSSVLETLSLHELNVRKENLLKQLQKVEIQINKVKKDNILIPKNKEEQNYYLNDIEFIQQQCKEDIINENDIKTIKTEKIVNPNIIKIHKKNSITGNDPINIKIVKIKMNIKKI